ncbi:MAG: helix-turn-helix domain-containing protein [Acidimicrobiia bacterium]|nr:helix-turn-helix domain-containing protein [Acidimicrobiia bacterium]
MYQGRQKGTTKAQPNRAAQLRSQGLTLREIASALRVSPRTAARYLRTTAS